MFSSLRAGIEVILANAHQYKLQHASSQNRSGLIQSRTMNASPNWDPGCAGEVAAPDAGGWTRFGCWRRWEVRRGLRESHVPWEVCDMTRVFRDVLEARSRQRWDAGAAALELDGVIIEESRQPWDLGVSRKCESLGRREHPGERSYESRPQWDSANVSAWGSPQRWDFDFAALACCDAVTKSSHRGGYSSIVMPEGRVGTSERSRGKGDSSVRRPRRAGKALRMAVEGLDQRSTVLGSVFHLQSLS